MKKIFVLDTNVLLHNASAVESFADNEVVLPMEVIEELDRFKAHNDELGRNARHVIRRLDALRQQGRLAEGVAMDNGGVLRILPDRRVAGFPDELDANVPDNKIIRAAYMLKGTGRRVIFVSKDINARLKADALGIDVMDFEKQKVNVDDLFSGYREMTVPGTVVDEFLANGSVTFKDGDFLPNEFVYMIDEGNRGHHALGRAREGHDVVALNPRFETAWKIKPRSKEQRMAMELLMDDSVQLVTLVGQAGTGKTLLALAVGLEKVVNQKRYDKILVSRPIMPLGKDIGYLPGDKDEKLLNWMLPIFDNLTYLMHNMNGSDQKHTIREKVEKLQRDQIVQLEALTYIRGRSIHRQYVIIDEAQNLTPHEVKTIVSRAGDGTKMVLTGDAYQIDNPYLDSSSNGLSYAVERLKNQQVHGHVTLLKSERSVLAAVAADLL